jgi:hypothetical protein
LVASAGFDRHQRQAVGRARAADAIALFAHCGIGAEPFDDRVQGGDFAAAFVDPHILVGQFTVGALPDWAAGEEVCFKMKHTSVRTVRPSGLVGFLGGLHRCWPPGGGQPTAPLGYIAGVAIPGCFSLQEYEVRFYGQPPI